jgi:hypothetical protein
VRNQPLGDSGASVVPVSPLAKDDSNILDKGSTADTDKTRKQQQCAENTIIQKQAILEELQVTVHLCHIILRFSLEIVNHTVILCVFTVSWFKLVT